MLSSDSARITGSSGPGDYHTAVSVERGRFLGRPTFDSIGGVYVCCGQYGGRHHGHVRAAHVCLDAVGLLDAFDQPRSASGAADHGDTSRCYLDTANPGKFCPRAARMVLALCHERGWRPECGAYHAARFLMGMDGVGSPEQLGMLSLTNQSSPTKKQIRCLGCEGRWRD